MNDTDLLSVCKSRTNLDLGCRRCIARSECIPFKFNHNGLSPYEYNKLKEEVPTNEKTEQ